MIFIAWPEIESFHNVRKFIRIDPTEWWRAKEQLGGTSTVHYKAKIKLHGTSAAVQISADGTITPQSRTNFLSLENDNAGFCRWVVATCMHMPGVGAMHYWDKAKGHIIFGEWIGPGIQKGVAVSEIPKKVFAVFAARNINDPNSLIVEPEELRHLVEGIPDVYVLPWYEKEIDINWKQSDEELTKTTAIINDWVAAVEASDPWVEATFGVKGTGEGLVFYPTSEAHLGFVSFTNLVFKAKGEKHKNIKTAAPAQVNPEAVVSVDAFVELVLTLARLEQGATSIGGFDMKLTGKFVNWCLADVQKETTDELEASGLDWKQVEKPLTNKARLWYLEQAKVR